MALFKTISIFEYLQNESILRFFERFHGVFIFSSLKKEHVSGQS